MKNRLIISIAVSLLLAGLGMTLFGLLKPNPKDLSCWVRAGGDRDWSGEAARNKREAQFYLGLTLIRTNLVTQIDRVPWLSAVPIVGKRFFENITYRLDNDLAQEQLAEAHKWIKKSADQGYAPAKEAEKLFVGRVAVLEQSAEPTRPTAERPKL